MNMLYLIFDQQNNLLVYVSELFYLPVLFKMWIREVYYFILPLCHSVPYIFALIAMCVDTNWSCKGTIAIAALFVPTFCLLWYCRYLELAFSLCMLKG